MAFQSSNIDLAVEFNLNNAPIDFKIIDNTDYSGETYTNILGVLRAVAPSGSQFYNNTNFASPDIDINTSTQSSILGNIPLVSSLVPNGYYNFIYGILIEDMLQSNLVLSSNIATKTFKVNGNIAAQMIEASAGNWEIVDSTTTSLTIVSATYSGVTGETTIVVNETFPILTSLAQFQYTVDVNYSKTFAQDYTYTTPMNCIDVDIDECCSSLTLTDTTAYPIGSTITRLHTISYPIGMENPIDDVLSPLQSVTITPIWTGTWTDVFTTTINAANGIINIIDESRFVKKFNVSATQGLCEVYSCITNMATKYAAYLTTAPQKAIELGKSINQASAAYMAYTIGKKCGTEGFEIYLQLIKDIADNCGCGCSDCLPCEDNAPQQVVGYCENVGGSTNTILVISGNGSLTITTNTVGDTTTFDIKVSSTFVTGLAEQAIENASINDIGDVNTDNITAANGQGLIWSTALGKWVRGNISTTLRELSDVDDTGLANNMILYYEAATQTFKFRISATPKLEDLTDVTISSITGGQILRWNGTAWVNSSYTYRGLDDVKDVGMSDGNSFKWDAATSKFIPFSPKLTLSSLDDLSASIPTTGQRLMYNAGTNEWDRISVPISADALTLYQSGYAQGPTVGFSDAGYSYDAITNMVNLVGVITNANGLVATTPVFLAQLPSGAIPTVHIPITCHVGIGSTTYLAMGYISTTGGIYIAKYYTGAAIVNGIPAGGICLETIQFRLNR